MWSLRTSAGLCECVIWSVKEGRNSVSGSRKGGRVTSRVIQRGSVRKGGGAREEGEDAGTEREAGVDRWTSEKERAK